MTNPAWFPLRQAERIPVYRPRLPTAEKLLPYLQRIDSTRLYSNHGPLVAELTRRLSGMLGVSEGCVATAASGHAALVATILAHAGYARPERPLALIPAFTFCSTALAAEQCGYEPYLLDVDPHTWQLDPKALLGHPLRHKAGLIMPVASFGAPFDIGPWEDFQVETGVPVVIDAAAAFASLAEGSTRAGSVPVVVSFHATKCFSTGEGGGVVSTNPDLIERVVQATNFGFHADRRCEVASFNGKMSEYHAAVGLAQADEWEQTRQDWRYIADSYRVEAAAAGVWQNIVLAPDVAVNHAFYRAPSAAIGARAASALEVAGLDTRFWYGAGLHRHPHFANKPRDFLPETESLCGSLVGLPMAIDLRPSGAARSMVVLAGIERDERRFVAESFGDDCENQPMEAVARAS